MIKNVDTAKKILAAVVQTIPEKRECPCTGALGCSIITSPEHVSEETRKMLEPIIKKYM